MKERAVLFGETSSLVGVVTDPLEERGDASKAAVILLNPGIVHRVGPGRVYVKIARRLAAAGFLVLRFDLSGIGDSAVRHDSLPFAKSSIQEAQKAMDFLHAARGTAQFVLVGGCSGAEVSLETACLDSRVIGAVLMNFPVTQNEAEETNPDQLNRNAAHYYWNFALFNLKSWRKLFTGKADYQRLIRALAFAVRPHFSSRPQASREISRLRAQLQYLSERAIPLSFVYSEGDPRRHDLRGMVGDELKQLCARGKVMLKTVPRADHTFSSLHDHERLLELLLEQVEIITRSNKDQAVVSRTAAVPLLPLNIGDSVAQL